MRRTTRVTHRLIVGAVVLASLVALFSAMLTFAQPRQAVATSSPSTVEVLVTVTDKEGKSVPRLTRTDFKVFEDGKAQTITGFSDPSTLGSVIVIMVDRSGSTRDNEWELDSVFDASFPLIDALLQTGQAKAALVTMINGSVVVNQNLTDDPAKLKEAIKATRGQSWGGTSFYDALTSVASVLTNFHGRKLILSIGDGDDTSSRFSRQSAIGALQRSNAIVDAVFVMPGRRLGPLNNTQRGQEILRRTAEETGGRLLDSKDVRQQFESIRSELAGQYNLQYQSSNPINDGKFRKIRVDVVDKDYRVRHRAGH
jgi:Ca-activated chloride channel family protein